MKIVSISEKTNWTVIDDKITYQHLKFMKTVQLLRFEILGDIGSFLSAVVEPLKRGWWSHT